jgi:hypothetical protein
VPERDKSWYDRAKCRFFRNPALFHDMSLEGDPVGALAELQAVCRDCPVRRACRDFVDDMELGNTDAKCHGFWAGETVKDRLARRLRKKLRAKKKRERAA